ncbi:MAG: alginate export family protein [Gammaproteobacteria bacterium]|nr:alginate export family protein [Gammaproteobacteria bacterium]
MKTSTRTIILAGLGALCAQPTFADSFSDAISEGETHLNLRYRYEFVDQDSFSENANASTLRGRLNWLSGGYNNFRGFVEFDAVGEIFIDDYNSGMGTSSPVRSRYPVVADPNGTDLNQVYLQYSGWEGTNVRVGRQRILLDNQRFVGGVGWRQNEQTYDAASITHKFNDNAKVFYAYVDNVNRIFGEDVAAGDHESSTHLLNASYKFEDTGTLTGYYYGIDNDDSPGASTDTIGVRFTGGTSFSDRPVKYLVEYARQSDAANNPVDYDADYFRLDGSINLGQVTAMAGYELLSGDSSMGGAAFRTPLATLHAFNGWADQFLGTPSSGLTDTWVGASGKLDVWSWKALYHFLDSDESSADFGDEIDLSIGRKVGENYGVLFKAAMFNADAASFVDVTKFWFMFTANY